MCLVFWSSISWLQNLSRESQGKLWFTRESVVVFSQMIPNFKIMQNWLEPFQRVCQCVKAGKQADWKDLLLFGKACWSKPKTTLWCVNQTPYGERPVADEKETDRFVKIGKTYRKSTGINVALIWQCLHQALWSKISIITATSVALVNGRFKEWYFSMKCKFNPIRLHITNKPCPINQPSTKSHCYFQNYIII